MSNAYGQLAMLSRSMVVIATPNGVRGKQSRF